MLLPALELLERRHPRILVIERDNEADRNLVVFLMIDEAAAPCVVERPALRVDHAAGHMLGRIDVPQLLDAEAIGLRITVALQLKQALELLGQVPARALGEEGVAAVQLHAGLIFALLGAVLCDAEISGGDALHRAILVEQYFSGGEAGEDLYAQRLGLTRQPTAEIAERERVGALVVHEARHREVGHFPLAALA